MPKTKKTNKGLIGKSGKKIVKKEPGMNVGASFSPNSSTAQGTVPTPPTGSTASTVMYWPSPQAFYQQGKEMAKKAYNDYLNAVNQYMNAPDDQFDQKMQHAGKMNSLAQSFVQGVSLGTEGAENIFRRMRTGDQAALIEIEVVKDILTKMLKTLWVHNEAARSGKHAGLEAKLLEQQLVTRIHQSTGLDTTDYGITLSSPEEADTIWVDQTMPSEATQVNTTLPEDMQGEEEIPEEAVDSEIPPEEMGEEAPLEEEVPIEEDALPEETEEEIPMEEEIPEGMPEEEMPLEEEAPVEDMSLEEEVPEEEMSEGEFPEEEGEEIPEEEIVEGEELPEEEMMDSPEEEIEENVLPEPSGPDGFYTKEDLIQYGEDLLASVQEDTGEEEEVLEGEEPVEEEEVIDEEPVEEEVEEISDDEETFYCIECDREVDATEVEECDNPDCPFKKEIMDEEESDDVPMEDEEEIPIEEDTVPIEEEEAPEEVPDEEEIPEKKKTESKHFAMMDNQIHDDHNVKTITLKEFTGLEGEYCLDCQKIISYSFDQNTWTSEAAKRWIGKQIKVAQIKNKSPEKIIEETLDKLPEEMLESWIANESSKVETKSMKVENEVDLTTDDMEKVFNSDALRNVMDEVFSPILKRLKYLEA